MKAPEGQPQRELNATNLVVELSALKPKLKPDFRVLCDALSYCVVGIEHILMTLHDDEMTEN